jgi:hypothetical protein
MGDIAPGRPSVVLAAIALGLQALGLAITELARRGPMSRAVESII